jgi:hypothetical protein
MFYRTTPAEHSSFTLQAYRTRMHLTYGEELTWCLCQKYRVGSNNPTVCFAGYYNTLEVALTIDCSTILNSELWFVATRMCFWNFLRNPHCLVVTKFFDWNSRALIFPPLSRKSFCHACSSTQSGKWRIYLREFSQSLQTSFRSVRPALSFSIT